MPGTRCSCRASWMRTRTSTSWSRVPELLREAIPRGLTAVVTEMAQLSSALGAAGARWFLETLGAQPIHAYATAPVITYLSAEQGPGEPLVDEATMGALLEDPRVLGLGEVYWHRLLPEPDRLLPLIDRARALGKTVEGHASRGAGTSARGLCRRGARLLPRADHRRRGARPPPAGHARHDPRGFRPAGSGGGARRPPHWRVTPPGDAGLRWDLAAGPARARLHGRHRATRDRPRAPAGHGVPDGEPPRGGALRPGSGARAGSRRAAGPTSWSCPTSARSARRSSWRGARSWPGTGVASSRAPRCPCPRAFITGPGRGRSIRLPCECPRRARRPRSA